MAPRHEPESPSGAMKKVKPNPRKQYRKTFIREWRKYRGLTLERLSDRVGLTPSALSYLERGQSGYSQDTLELLAHALQTDPASLIMRNPNDEEAIWSIWDNASEGEKRQISEVVKALKRAS
jgi:transcriptional regulator with XRE-family HTH domain